MNNPIDFVFLAEFDIDEGSILKHSYPGPTGVDEHLLAEHMLPDGAHDRNEDWTIFYLNQIPGLTVKNSSSPILPSKDTSEDNSNLLVGNLTLEDVEKLPQGVDNNRRKDEEEGGLLYVVNLVRTKKVATVRRGALVKALAVASRSPYIQIYKPILLLALDDYFNDPTISCLARLFTAINSMDLTSMPILSLHERLVLRTSDRKDMFEEKFINISSPQPIRRDSSIPSLSHLGEESLDSSEILETHRRSISSSSIASKLSKEFKNNNDTNNNSNEDIPSWRSTKSRSNTISSADWTGNRSEGESGHVKQRLSRSKDTHWFDSRIIYNGIPLPIRIPLGTFPEEVGDYSLVKLIQIFSSPTALQPIGPLHSHLHTNGTTTHPIVLLFNALVTYKRVVFLGHGQAAGDLANLVLAACALGSGCGSVLKGFTDRAFPYTNLSNLDNLQSVTGFIAGVCNPAFVNRPGWWDVLCNIETGKIIVSKDIASTPIPLRNNSLSPLTNSISNMSPEEIENMKNFGPGLGPGKIDKVESADTYFMEEITSAIQSHYGEAVIRARFTDYTHRFVRLASLYEEDYLGNTVIGFPCYSYSNAKASSLGSGIVFNDEPTKLRELGASLGRIEGWRGTTSYSLYKLDFYNRQSELSARKFDLLHQMARLRQGKSMPDGEVELILKTFSKECRTNEGLLGILAYLPPHFGGLLPLAFGLFHPSENARHSTLDFLDTLSHSETGRKFIQSLNTFHRSAYERASKERLSQSFGGSTFNPSTSTNYTSSPPPNSVPLSFSQDRKPSFTSPFS